MGPQMNIRPTLQDIDPKVSASIFETRYRPLLIEHLKNTCILDDKGTSRVIALLHAGFSSGLKEIIANFDSNPNDARFSKLHDEQSIVRQEINVIAKGMGDAAMLLLESVLISMATQLARHDEIAYPRPRH